MFIVLLTRCGHVCGRHNVIYASMTEIFTASFFNNVIFCCPLLHKHSNTTRDQSIWLVTWIIHDNLANFSSRFSVKKHIFVRM